MFKLPHSVIMPGSVLDFLPACWRRMPTEKEIGTNWRTLTNIHHVGGLFNNSFNDRYKEFNRGQNHPRKVVESVTGRTELWAHITDDNSKGFGCTLPIVWSYTNDGKVNSHSNGNELKAAIKTRALGVFIRNDVVCRDDGPAVMSPVNVGPRLRVLQTPIGNVWLSFNGLEETWKRGQIVDMKVAEVFLHFEGHFVEGHPTKSFSSQRVTDWEMPIPIPSCRYDQLEPQDQFILLDWLGWLTKS